MSPSYGFNVPIQSAPVGQNGQVGSYERREKACHQHTARGQVIEYRGECAGQVGLASFPGSTPQLFSAPFRTASDKKLGRRPGNESKVGWAELEKNADSITCRNHYNGVK